MFETTVVESKRRRVRTVFLSTLPVSATVHLIIAAGLLLASIWNIALPRHPPMQAAAYAIASGPPPPPPPPPTPAARPKQVAPKVERPITPQEVLAPSVVPEFIPEVAPDEPVAIVGVEGGVEGGIEGGLVGGVFGGVTGEDTGSGIAVVQKQPGAPLVVERDAKLPMTPISQVYPSYPEKARLKRQEGSLLVKYTIDKRGRVREVLVLRPSHHEILNEAAVSAIRHWRFRPLLEDGKPIEVEHELTVIFQLQ